MGLQYCQTLVQACSTNLTTDSATLKCLNGYWFVMANSSDTILRDTSSQTWKSELLQICTRAKLFLNPFPNDKF